MGLFDYNDTNITAARDTRDTSPRRLGNQNKFKEVALKSCVFTVTGGYQDHVRRPYEVSVDREDIERLAESTRGGKYIGSSNIASVAGTIIKPSAEYEDYVGIDNGWAAPRMRFIIEFVRESMGGTLTRHVYIGFTDYVGVDLNGNIDPDMELHLTASLVLRETASLSRGRPVTRTTLVAYDQVVRSDDTFRRDASDQYVDMDNMKYLITPSDVFTNACSNYVLEDMDYAESFPFMSGIGRKPKKTRRTNLLPSSYLSTVLNSARSALDNSMDLHGAGETNSFGNAIEQSSENLISEDPIFSLFGSTTDINHRATVLWEDVLTLFPEADRSGVTVVNFPSRLQSLNNRNFSSVLDRTMEEERDSVNGWNDFRQETMIATIIAQQLPAIMMTNLIRDIRFNITNEVMNGIENPFEWVIGDRRRRDNGEAIKFAVDGLPTEMEMELFQGFQRRFESLIMMPLTRNNIDTDLSLMVDARCDGDIFISVQFNGGEMREYKMATFADSQASSVITSNRGRYEDVTKDLYNLSQHVLAF